MSNQPVNHSQYDESQIQVLEGLEAVRKRPGMYIGSTGINGLHHLVYEIVDNAIDEAMAGFCDEIHVDILENNVVRVTDNGRGIPVGIHPKEGISAATVAYTILHAGGKFGGGGYKVSGGLHGVGASVVNALSEWLELTIYNGEHVYFQHFDRGHYTEELKIIGDTDRTGTTVTFRPDAEIFEDVNFVYDTLLTRLREQAFLNAGIKIMPVVASVALAKRMERAGADAVIAEGMEGGGHIGELTTMPLVPQVVDALSIPVIAAGGIADGRGMAASFMLGAEGVQCGTVFLASNECCISDKYKELVLKATDISTVVTGRPSGHPVRSLKTPMARKCLELEKQNTDASLEELEKATAGSLRKAVQDELKRNRCVKRYRLGVYGEGEDGVTIAELA